MLPRANRLAYTSNVDTRTFSKKHFIWGVVLYTTNTCGRLRLSVIVGKKTRKKAVDRNRLKRQCTHSVLALLGTEAKLDVVIFLKPIEKFPSRTTLERDLKKLH